MRDSFRVKCKKGHIVFPVSYRQLDKIKSKIWSPVRIRNYWYCEKCNKVLKIQPRRESMIKVVYAK